MDFLVGLFDPNVTEQEDMPEILPPEVECHAQCFPWNL